ncbi:hypothetical protein [Smaragdicoccus niigatensis]|uniref:hypothetical protein n=1 Tax=Smaragdicoccus niigatensis TaxID=359359 RepID=UPI0012DD2FF0|nr:hypothetical protein [Smaragdicoccus niigatensis]
MNTRTLIGTAALCVALAGCSSTIHGVAKSKPGEVAVATTTVAEPTATTSPSQPTSTASKHWSMLIAGECITHLPGQGETFTMVDTVSCTSSHDAEVFAVESLVDPSDDAAAEKACGLAFADYVGVPVEHTKYTYNWLTAASSSHVTSSRAICVLFRADGSPITGSAHV